MKPARNSKLYLTDFTKVVKLYRSDPIDNAYLLYDLINYPEDTFLRFCTDWDYVLALIYRHALWGGHVCYIHVNYIPNYEHILEAVDFCLKDSTVNSIYITCPVNVEHYITDLCKSRNLVPKEKYRVYTMVLNVRKFRRFYDKVNVQRICNVYDICDILREWRGSAPNIENLRIRISQGERWYGIYLDSKLVSVASVYLRLPEVWIIGNVFTRPEYRGRGLAKAIVSYICEEALSNGALPVLHVFDNNPYFESAYRAYVRVGFEVHDVRFGYALIRAV